MFDIRSVLAAFGRKRPGGPYERGIADVEAGRYDAAIAAFEAVARDSNSGIERARAHNKRGVALLALQCRGDALTAFGEALCEDERCAAALTNIGNLLFEDASYEDAIDYYEAAIRADERYHVAYRNLGVALKRLGRREEAVKALRSAARRSAR